MARDLQRSLREALWPTTTTWWEVPDEGYVEVADVDESEGGLARLYGRQEERIERQAVVSLQRRPDDPRGPDSVEVRLERLPVGRLPARIAPAWSQRLAQLEERGVGTRALADVSYRFARRFAAPGVYVFLRIPEDPADMAGRAGSAEPRPDGPMGRDRPGEGDVERARMAAARAERERQSDEWRSAGRCAGCGTRLPSRGGHPPTRAYCFACRPPMDALPPAAYANTGCPYCSGAIAPLPTADLACPRCRALVHVRWGPDGLLYLLQAGDLGVLEDAWRESTASQG